MTLWDVDGQSCLEIASFLGLHGGVLDCSETSHGDGLSLDDGFSHETDDFGD